MPRRVSVKTVTISALLFFSLSTNLSPLAPATISAQMRTAKLDAAAKPESVIGDEAVESLRRTGSYYSLQEAIRKLPGTEVNRLLPANSERKIVGSDTGSFDLFGRSVAVSGDTAVVGAPGDDIGANTSQGSAYVFTRSGTNWTQQQKLTSSDGAAGDVFGYSVSISGDTIVVGAYLADVGANADQGAAYVFTRSSGTWTQQAKLTASDGAAGDFFGWSVSLKSDIAIVGAPFDDVTATDEGSAYIFMYNSGSWSQTGRANASDASANGGYGYSVSIYRGTWGYTFVVGAPYKDAVYISTFFAGSWSGQKLTPSDGAAGDYFGLSVAVEEDTLIVGSPFSYVSGVSQGSAYVFTRPAGTWNQQSWTQQQRLSASDGDTNDWLGFFVSVSGDSAILGAPKDDLGANPDQGSAYIFTRSAGTWSMSQKLTASDGDAGEEFGYSVFCDANTVISGAHKNHPGLSPNQGAAYTYSTLATTAAGAVISGRVLGINGSGLRNVTVVVTDLNGREHFAQTGTFGRFKITDLPVGANYVIGARSRHYQFAPMTLYLREDFDGLVIQAIGGRK